jgi:hypothetical protein
MASRHRTDYCLGFDGSIFGLKTVFIAVNMCGLNMGPEPKGGINHADCWCCSLTPWPLDV